LLPIQKIMITGNQNDLDANFCVETTYLNTKSSPTRIFFKKPTNTFYNMSHLIISIDDEIIGPIDSNFHTSSTEESVSASLIHSQENTSNISLGTLEANSTCQVSYKIESIHVNTNSTEMLETEIALIVQINNNQFIKLKRIN